MSAPGASITSPEPSTSSSKPSSSCSSPSSTGTSPVTKPQPTTDTNRKSRRQLANARRKKARQQELEKARKDDIQSTRQANHLAAKARQLSRKSCRQFSSAITAAREADKAIKAASTSDFTSRAHFNKFKDQHKSRQVSRELLDTAVNTASKALQIASASKSSSASALFPLPSPSEGLEHIHKRLFH